MNLDLIRISFIMKFMINELKKHFFYKCYNNSLILIILIIRDSISEYFNMVRYVIISIIQKK